MTVRRREPIQGAQFGPGNEQQNYFAPVTQYLFSGGFERLRDVCFDPAPLARDLDLAWFTGREWLISKIDAFITSRPRGYVIIQAEAGVGKSTLAARLAGTRPWLCHFTRLPGGGSPEAARKSLAAQLIARWDLREWAPEGVLPVSSSRPDWFSRLLEAAARKRDQQEPDEQRREPIVMVVDGLDEAEPEAGGGRGLPLGLPESPPLAGHADWVSTVAVGRAGDRDIIVSGSGDGTVRVWDAVTGDPVGSPLAGHAGRVSAVAVGRAGDRDIIVSGSGDRTVLIRQHRLLRQAR